MISEEENNAINIFTGMVVAAGDKNDKKNWNIILNLIERQEQTIEGYKQLTEKIDNKEVSDALHMLLHCSLKDTEYETQKEQFEIVNSYINQLEQTIKQLQEIKKEAILDDLGKQYNVYRDEENDKEIEQILKEQDYCKDGYKNWRKDMLKGMKAISDRDNKEE